MIEFLVSFLPFVVCMLMARRLARRGIPGPSRFSADRQPTALYRPSLDAVPPAVIAAVTPTEDAEAREVTPAPWTALDDLQLDRLLKEASS